MGYHKYPCVFSYTPNAIVNAISFAPQNEKKKHREGENPCRKPPSVPRILLVQVSDLISTIKWFSPSFVVRV